MSIGWVLLIAAAAFIVGCLTTEIWFLSHGYQIRARANQDSDTANIAPLRPPAKTRGNSRHE